MAFDVLALDGERTLRLSYSERHALLEEVTIDGPPSVVEVACWSLPTYVLRTELWVRISSTSFRTAATTTREAREATTFVDAGGGINQER
jgi:hypothetical protein